MTIYAGYHYGQRSVNDMIWSSVTDKWYHAHFARQGGDRYAGGYVTVTGPSGIWARFSGDI